MTGAPPGDGGPRFTRASRAGTSDRPHGRARGALMASSRYSSARTALRVAGLAVALAAAAAGCAAPAPRPAAAAPRLAAAARAAGTSRVSAATAGAACDPEASSLAPLGPPEVTPGSYMAKIKARGYLIAGVDQSTYHFGYLNPLDGQIEGFDIDMIRAVAQAIFGDPNKVEFKAISDAQRIPAVTSGSGRHRRAHDDDHLRPPQAGRFLQRLLRRPSAGPHPRRIEGDQRPGRPRPARRYARPRARTR